MWDERVPIHVGSDFYDVEGFLAGATTLRPFELEESWAASTGARSCTPSATSGLDTLLGGRGAPRHGLDFSGPAVEGRPATSPRAPGLERRLRAGDVYARAGARRPALRHRLHGARAISTGCRTSSAGRG